jgi:hypothetical protein
MFSTDMTFVHAGEGRRQITRANEKPEGKIILYIKTLPQRGTTEGIHSSLEPHRIERSTDQDEPGQSFRIFGTRSSRVMHQSTHHIITLYNLIGILRLGRTLRIDDSVRSF